MILNKFNHLGDSLGRQDRQQISYKQELVTLIIDGGSRFIFTEGDTFTFVGSAPASVDKWWMESVHIKVFVVDEETLSDGAISVCVCVNVKPKQVNPASLNT